MNEKDELIIMRNRLTELSNKYKSEISNHMKEKKILNTLSNLSNSLMVSAKNLDTAIFYKIKLEQELGEKYESS